LLRDVAVVPPFIFRLVAAVTSDHEVELVEYNYEAMRQASYPEFHSLMQTMTAWQALRLRAPMWEYSAVRTDSARPKR